MIKFLNVIQSQRTETGKTKTQSVKLNSQYILQVKESTKEFDLLQHYTLLPLAILHFFYI